MAINQKRNNPINQIQIFLFYFNLKQTNQSLINQFNCNIHKNINKSKTNKKKTKN